MRNLISAIVFIAGVILGLYWGFWCCAVGGIVQVVNSIKSTPTDAIGVALGVLKFMAAGLVGWGTFWLGLFIAGSIDK